MTLGLFLKNFGRNNEEQGPTEKHGKHISGLVCKDQDKTRETRLKAACLEMMPSATRWIHKKNENKKLITQSTVNGCSVGSVGKGYFGVISLGRNWVGFYN